MMEEGFDMYLWVYAWSGLKSQSGKTGLVASFLCVLIWGTKRGRGQRSMSACIVQQKLPNSLV